MHIVRNFWVFFFFFENFFKKVEKKLNHINLNYNKNLHYVLYRMCMYVYKSFHTLLHKYKLIHKKSYSMGNIFATNKTELIPEYY